MLDSNQDQNETNVSDDQRQGEVNTADTELSIEEQLKKLKEERDQLASSKMRLEEESRRYKSRMKKAEEDKLLAEGKKDEVIKTLQERVSSYEQMEESTLIATAIATEAKKRNCPHWDHLYKVTDGSGIEIDQETGEVLGVSEFFDKYENDDNFSMYFSKSAPIKTDNRTPSNVSSSFNYRTQTKEYLLQEKKKGYDHYLRAVELCRKEGLIR